jgi:general secretion pathway protein A
MELSGAGLSKQPFPTHGKPRSVVSYASKTAALEMLADTCHHPTGLSLLQGPPLSGKSTIIRSFVDSMHEDCSVAVIDGRRLNTTNLLISVLRQFGYSPDLSSASELLGLVRVFAIQQATSNESPLLIVENAHDLNPSALHALCELAELRVQTSSAVKMVLVSDRPLKTVIAATAMASMSKRLLHDFHLRPMNRDETKSLLHSKLRSAGSDYPEYLFPDAICADIWRASGGWPGVTGRVALLALAKAKTLPVSVMDVEHPALPSGTWTDAAQQSVDLPHLTKELKSAELPRLIVTNNGSVMSDLTMQRARLLIGRSEHNDISINSRFISRHHSLLVRHGATTFLMDLNSSNGTFVNSKRVSNHVLVHDDVITIGHHRVKFHDTNATAGRALEGPEFDDTMIMKTLEDMRNLLAKENMSLLPAVSENLPTIQT